MIIIDEENENNRFLWGSTPATTWDIQFHNAELWDFVWEGIRSRNMHQICKFKIIDFLFF